MLWNVSFVFAMIMLLTSSTEAFTPLPRGSSAWGYFTPPILQRVPQQTPMEEMVELTNDLAVAILQDHSFSRGNFAFSPYGVASVLVVLYEGARGESARQIHRAVGFPSDKDVIRIGFRDIHRHLRSYFSHEGYLSGISLNRQGSSLKPEYKKILRFYGYDVEFNHALEEENEPIKTSASVAPSKTTQTATDQPTTESKVSTIQSTTATEKTVTNGGQKLEKTTTDFSTAVTEPTEREDQEIQTTTVYNSNCSLINKGKQEGCGSVAETATEKQSEDREMLLTSTELPVTEPKTTEAPNVELIDLSLDNGMLIPQPDDAEAMTTVKSITTTAAAETATTTATASPTTTELASTVQETISTLKEMETTPTEMTSTVVTETPPAIPTETTTLVSDEVKKASKNGMKTAKSVTKVKEKSVKNIRNMFDMKSLSWLTPRNRGNSMALTFRRSRTIADYLKTPHNPQLSLQLQNGMYDTHISRNANMYRTLPRLLFLVDGAIDTPVPMMTYSSVFSYAYIPRLHSKAMEFPLDDNRYKLLILLPVERRGLRQLIYDLSGVPLNNVLKALQPQRVKVVVPTFMVEGFVILTSSLQKLGIWDVFDPRKANLSGMSMDPELYVRNVEQSVTVVIRNYVEILDIQTRTMAARHMEQEFEATHPFLYFVMDTATNVALMAGQILDPLNSRIY